MVLDIYKGTYNRISFEENRANESVRIFYGETGCTQKRNVFIRVRFLEINSMYWNLIYPEINEIKFILQRKIMNDQL